MYISSVFPNLVTMLAKTLANVSPRLMTIDCNGKWRKDMCVRTVVSLSCLMGKVFVGNHGCRMKAMDERSNFQSISDLRVLPLQIAQTATL